jgi:hypothetical protein
MSVISNVPKDTALRIRVASTLVLTGTIRHDGTPVDLTGAAVAGKIGLTTITATITDALGGVFELVIPPAAVPSATETTWYLDLTDSLSRVTPLFRGVASVVA